MAQLDLRHILRLHLVDTKCNHQVGDNILLRFGLPDDFDCFVDVQQNLLQAFQQMLFFLLFSQVEVDSALDAQLTEGNPFL